MVITVLVVLALAAIGYALYKSKPVVKTEVSKVESEVKGGAQESRKEL